MATDDRGLPTTGSADVQQPGRRAEQQSEAAHQHYAEQARRRADRLAMLNEIGRTVSTLRDLSSVLTAIYWQAQQNLPMDAFFVALYNPTSAMLSFPITYDNGQLWHETEAPMQPESRIGRVIMSGQPLLINLSEEQLQQPRTPNMMIGDMSKVSASLMFAPLQAGDTIIGVISAQSYTLNAYNDDDLGLLTGIAHQVAIAIDNARLYEQTRRRANQLAMLNEVGRAVSTLRDLDGVLEVMYQQVQRILPLDVFLVGLLQPGSNTMIWPFLYDEGKRYEEPPTLLKPTSLVSRVLQSGKAEILNRNIRALQLPIDSNTLIGNATKRSSSLMYAPLQVGKQVIGIISVQSYTPKAYTDDDCTLLMGIAYQAAIAIENARLYTAVQQELAERQALIQKLEMQNSELERFTYTVSHDLKSPLVTIGSFLGFVQQDAQAGNLERLNADIKQISTAVNNMHRLLDELLELSRVGRQANPTERIPFAEIVTDALERTRGRWEAHHVSIEVCKPLPTVCGDRTRLVEVIQNLVDNATKFIGDQPYPRIVIGAEPIEGTWQFFVRDNGIGIDPRYHQKIFGLFEKLDKQGEGTGIGLALVKRIIEVHGGRIWVESSLGQGTTFFFTLASATPEPPPDSADA